MVRHLLHVSRRREYDDIKLRPIEKTLMADDRRTQVDREEKLTISFSDSALVVIARRAQSLIGNRAIDHLYE